MERWTRLVLRFRWPVVALWALFVVAGFAGNARLGDLLSNQFTVPGTDSERARSILQHHWGERSDGTFTVVLRLRDGGAARALPRLQARLERAARAIPTGKATPLVVGSDRVLYGDVVSQLELNDAKGLTKPLLAALGRPPGVEVFVTGAAPIQGELDPILAHDVTRGEMIAIPIALLVLLLVFGLSFAVTIPFLFAASTIFGTLGLVYLFAHVVTTAIYAKNLVQLIGLGIAVDYSLLVVYRFREELARGLEPDDAIVRTMRTAGRAVIFSGATVAIGLALLLFMPLPFMSSMGLAGLLIPLVSVGAATTLQPALLSLYGRRGVRRAPVGGRLRAAVRDKLSRAEDAEQGFWARLARSIMARPWLYLLLGGAALLAAAAPALGLRLTPGSAEGIPSSPQSVRGFHVLRDAVGPGALSPTQVVVDAGPGGRVLAAPTQAALARLVRLARADPETASVLYAPLGRFLEPSGRYAQLVVVGRHEYGDRPSQAFVRRLRDRLVPAARFPDGVRALAGGGPPQGVDFLSRSYAVFPWLVLAVLGLTYVVLLRAFRSVVLPLKAVILNLLSVAASYGMLVLFFRYGLGEDLLGLYRTGQIEGWIPIFLFAMLFGLSMDYEVFLVTRMREAWDETQDNTRAVAIGLERTGRIVTAAAAIMVAAFSGFLAGSIVGLQEFGLGLAVAILLDATIVRALLVPGLMAVLGRWNWWLPGRLARLARVEPSPLEPAPGTRLAS